MPEPETLGARLKALRLAAGLSQRELAAEVGVTFPHISKVETGREQASAELIGRIAEAVGADPAELLLLADRLPDDLRDQVVENPELATRFLRSWKAGNITDKDIEKLLKRRGEP